MGQVRKRTNDDVGKMLRMKQWVGVYRRKGTDGNITYYVNYRRRGDGKLIWKRVGTSRDGVTPPLAFQHRLELIELNKTSHDHKAAPPAMINLDEACEKYLAWAEGENKEVGNFVSSYNNHVKKYLGHKLLIDITPKYLDRCKILWQKDGQSPASVNWLLSVVSRIYGRMIKQGEYDRTNPVQAVDKLRLPNRGQRLRYLSFDEAQLLLEKAQDHTTTENQLDKKILMALHTGIRRAGLMNLRVRDIDFASNVINVQDKGNSRSVPINSITRPLLEKLCEDKGRNDFIWNAPKFPATPWNTTLKDCEFNKGLDPREDQAHRVVWHTLRHTFASWLVQAGEPLTTVQQLMGHASINQTMVYAKLAPSQTFDAAARLGERFAEGKIL